MRNFDDGIREQIQFRESTPLYHTVKPGGFIHNITTFLRGTVTFAAGAANGNLLGLGLPNLVQRIDLDTVAKAGSPYPYGKLVSLGPRSIFHRRVFDYGRADLTLPANFDGRAGTFDVDIPYPIEFALPNLVRGAECALATNEYDGMQLQFTTGGRDTMFSGNDRTFTHALNLEIYDYRVTSAPNGAPTAVLFQHEQAIPIAGDNDRWPIDGQLPQGESFIDLLLMAEQGATQQLSDSLIEKIAVKTGLEQFVTYNPRRVKQNQRKYIKDAAQSETGLYLLEIARDGLLSTAHRPIALELAVKNPSGANLDRLILSHRRVILPGEFMPKVAK